MSATNTNFVIPGHRAAASPESIGPAMRAWIPCSRLWAHPKVTVLAIAHFLAHYDCGLLCGCVRPRMYYV